MPFIRFITFSFLFVILLIAIVGPGDHPWFTNEVLWLAVLFAFCVWLMALKKDFFLNIMAFFFSAFFLQRIVVIYFRPDQMSYQGHLKFSSQVFGEAILFCIAISIAILIGYFLAIYRIKDIQKQKPEVINFDKLFRIRYDFEHLFKVYSFFFFVAIILEVFLMVKFKVGLNALDFNRQFAPLIRIVYIVQTLCFLPILVLTSGKFSPRVRKTAPYLVILILIRLIFFQTSKAAAISFCVIFFVCLHFCGRRVTKKYVVIGGILLVFTIFVLAPVTTILRSGIIRLVTGVSNFSGVLQMVLYYCTLTVDRLFFSFMNRMGAFDWLVGFMTVGRDAFLPWASISNDLIGILNSFLPGDLIKSSLGDMTISKLMPHILSGWALGSYPGHAENMGGIGMAYLYFGKIGGVLFFFAWSFILVKILKFNSNSIIKVLFFTSIVITFFLGGSFVTMIKNIYEGLIMFTILIFVSKIFVYDRNDSMKSRRKANNCCIQ